MCSIGQALRSRKLNLWCMLAVAVLYSLNKLVLIPHATGAVGYFCRCYLNDLVCPLFFLGYCQIFLIWIGRELVYYRHCLLWGMTGGLVWEYIAPLLNARAVSDPLDLLCYFAGTTVYFILLRRELRQRPADFAK